MYQLLAPVLYICGLLSLIMSGLLLLPVGYAYFFDDPEFPAFWLAFKLVFATGVLLFVLFRRKSLRLSSRQLYLVTTGAWLLLSIAGAMPLLLIEHPLSWADAFFEAISGITTTGSTVLSGLADLPHSILLWRSVLQWVGGLGVIGMAVSIFPFLRVGGMRLFQTESSDWSDKSLPRFHSLARSLLLTYVLITGCCVLSYWLAGMSLFDAVNHAMTTVSTGGYATDDQSMGRFSLGILWIAILFMLLGGMPFILLIHMWMQRSLKRLADEQVKGFLLIVSFFALTLTFYLIYTAQVPPFEALTHAAFNVTSVITTTGYASTDYTLWGKFSVGVFFVIMFIGGCSGSTSGGMKVFRYQLSFRFLSQQLKKLVHPRGVFAIRYNGNRVQEDIIASAIAFSFVFFVSLALVTLLLTLVGIDFVTSLTGAATALTNVGPGLGPTIGPAGNFAPLPDIAKWILSCAMILGRLELLTVIVLLTPVFWRG